MTNVHPDHMADALLQIENLRTYFYGGNGVARAVDQAAPWRFVFRFGQEY